VRLKSGECVDRVEEFSVATMPTSIVTGSDGQVWFDDDGVNQLVQLDSEGRVLKRVDCNANSSPRALVGGRDDALVWYTDAGAQTLNRVTQTSGTPFELKFTASALALGEGDELWLSEADQAIYQMRPYVSITPYAAAPSRALVFGPDQNLWFPTGTLMARLTPAQDPEYFSLGDSSANELCVGPDEALWFTDTAQHRIGRLALNGKSQLFDLPPGSGPTRIVAGPDGALWFIAEGGDKIGRISVDGEATQYPIPTSGGLPYALTVGGDHNLWFTEKFSGKIGRLIPDPFE
jgi:streptogramin lyase